MIAALADLLSTSTGTVLFGVLVTGSWIVGVVFSVALFWPRLTSTRGQTFDADGHCTCRRLEEERAHVAHLYRQERLTRSAFIHGTVTGFHGQGIGR
jgi:hypothetical protein